MTDEITGEEAVQAAVAAVFREQWGRLVATLIRVTGDWDLAEECTQDAFARALARWPTNGIPDRPGAWLTTTARNQALDRLRRDRPGLRPRPLHVIVMDVRWRSRRSQLSERAVRESMSVVGLVVG